MTLYLWIKLLHLVFLIAFMAVVFYLPRILVNLGEAGNLAPVRERLALMGLRLYRFGHVMFGLAFLFGLVLWLGYRVLPDFPTMVVAGTGWMHAKLALVVLALGYHHACRLLLRKFEQFANQRSERWFRVFNETAVLLFTAIVVLAVVKPF